MKIALVGKGGSGKTTLAALLLRHLASGGQGAIWLARSTRISFMVLARLPGLASSPPALADRTTTPEPAASQLRKPGHRGQMSR